MTKEQLEFYLNRKNVFGYNTEKNDKVVGWIKLSKLFPISGFFERFQDIADPKTVEEQMKIQREPYCVNIGQVTREAFDSDKYPGNDDYLLNVNYFFSNLDDVEKFIQDLGYDLSEIKWKVDFDFL
ncbi:MAG: hypothetical protein J0H74_04630 [Chitinophagaceae bacterium]|nr:hypothetical protein [Chitinophagaceae bacterium]